MIRAFIEWHCKPGKEDALDSLLQDLRSQSLHQPGYISGETLVEINDPTSFLVISTWTRLDTWQIWADSRHRLEIVDLMGPLVTADPVVRIYRVPSEE